MKIGAQWSEAMQLSESSSDFTRADKLEAEALTELAMLERSWGLTRDNHERCQGELCRRNERIDELKSCLGWKKRLLPLRVRRALNLVDEIERELFELEDEIDDLETVYRLLTAELESLTYQRTMLRHRILSDSDAEYRVLNRVYRESQNVVVQSDCLLRRVDAALALIEMQHWGGIRDVFGDDRRMQFHFSGSGGSSCTLEVVGQESEGLQAAILSYRGLLKRIPEESLLDFMKTEVSDFHFCFVDCFKSMRRGLEENCLRELRCQVWSLQQKLRFEIELFENSIEELLNSVSLAPDQVKLY